MELLWEEGELRAGEIVPILSARVGWNRNTTYTIIKKCVEKGAIRRIEPKFVCQPLVTKEQTQVYEIDVYKRQGSTSHYDYVCAEVSKGVATVGLNTGVPTLFGVLTTDNIEQAIERAGTKAGNKGYDVACSAIEMVNLMKEL